MYYFTYNLERVDLVPLLNGLSSVALVGIIAVPFLAKKLGKRNTLLLGFIISSLGQIILYLGAESVTIPTIITGRVLGMVGFGLVGGLKFAMIADTVDYGEWKSGVRAPGLLMAASTFGVKFGMGIGGSNRSMGSISRWLCSKSKSKALLH
ncbi:hypothetical protein GCM10020331_013750 [Ectobacillus funiculus]